MININQVKAQEITKGRIRDYRDLLLKDQDVAFQKALETSEDTATVVTEKQRLRGLPTLADNKTVDELKQIHAELGL